MTESLKTSQVCDEIFSGDRLKITYERIYNAWPSQNVTIKYFQFLRIYDELINNERQKRTVYKKSTDWSIPEIVPRATKKLLPLYILAQVMHASKTNTTKVYTRKIHIVRKPLSQILVIFHYLNKLLKQ